MEHAPRRYPWAIRTIWPAGTQPGKSHSSRPRSKVLTFASFLPPEQIFRSQRNANQVGATYLFWRIEVKFQVRFLPFEIARKSGCDTFLPWTIFACIKKGLHIFWH